MQYLTFDVCCTKWKTTVDKFVAEIYNPVVVVLEHGNALIIYLFVFCSEPDRLIRPVPGRFFYGSKGEHYIFRRMPVRHTLLRPAHIEFLCAFFNTLSKGGRNTKWYASIHEYIQNLISIMVTYNFDTIPGVRDFLCFHLRFLAIEIVHLLIHCIT